MIIIIISSSSSLGKLGLLEDLLADHWWSMHKRDEVQRKLAIVPIIVYCALERIQ